MKFSPWGKVDYEKKHQRGVTFVSTASHGGLLVSKGFAKKFLSEAAQKRGMPWGGYLAYEEDCLRAIVEYELPYVRTEDYADKLFKALSSWNADYLLERNIQPDPEGYKLFLRRKEDTRRRVEKDPNLITSASKLRDGVTLVCTADNKDYLVSEQSYSRNREAGNFNLSDCEIINDESNVGV